jgi:hypothetical protein
MRDSKQLVKVVFLYTTSISNAGLSTTFKHRHRIVSRKITEFVAEHALSNADKTEKLAIQFVEETKVEMQHYSPEEIMNTNQVGLKKALHSIRTLSYQVSEVVGPIYLCLKEQNGRIGRSEFAYSCFYSPN